jgi:hypothetical protein
MFGPKDSSPTKLKIPSPTQSPDSASGDAQAEPSAAELRFVTITEKMTKLDISVDPSNPNAINNTKIKLEEIIRDLEEFARDCAESGDAEKLPSLNGDISDLLQQVRTLHGHISKQAKAMDRYEGEGESYDEEELGREEIAKLLLLTSKAFRAGQISTEQRAFIKDKVIAREGYMRKILQQQELGTVVNALVTFANIP